MGVQHVSDQSRTALHRVVVVVMCSRKPSTGFDNSEPIDWFIYMEGQISKKFRRLE